MIEVLSALLTPTIGVALIVIAYLQWKTNDLRLRHEMFDRRYKIYKAAHHFVGIIAAFGDYTDEDYAAFLDGTAGARFAFDNTFGLRVEEILTRAEDLHMHERHLKSERRPGEREKIVRARQVEFDWLTKQLKELPTAAEEFLLLT